MRPNLTLTVFTPAEAEKISGVSTDKQRDWRRHGYLPSMDGHARFDIFALAKMAMMGMMSEHGIGPKRSHEDCDWSAQFIANFALLSLSAWEGEMEQITASYIAEAHEAQNREQDNAGEWLPDILRNFLWADRKLARIVPNRYSVWLPNSEVRFIHQIDDPQQRYGNSDPVPAGPFIAVEHQQIAALLLERAGRALCHVEMLDDE